MIEFGSYNTLTGETSVGHIDKDDKMQFTPVPWLKRLIEKLKPKSEPKGGVVTEYIGTTQFYSKWIWSSNKEYFDVAIYRTYDKLTNKTIFVYSDVRNHGRIYYNKDAFDRDKLLICENL